MYFAAATEHDPQWYKAWHAWAYMNCETVLLYKHQQEDKVPKRVECVIFNCSLPSGLSLLYLIYLQTKEAYVFQYAVPAVEGFFKSIALSKGNSLQDTLRMLTLWFDYGQYKYV